MVEVEKHLRNEDTNTRIRKHGMPKIFGKNEE